MSGAQFRLLQPGDEPAFEAYLRPRWQRSMFLLSNVHRVGLAYADRPFHGTYGAAFEGGEIVAVVSHFWNDNLNLQAPVYLRELIDFVVEQSRRPIKGFAGPADQVQAAVDHLRVGLSADTVQMDEPEWLYSLSLDHLRLPEALRTGEVIGRPIESRDVDTAAAWMAKFRVALVNVKDDEALRRQCRSTMTDAVSHGGRWVLEDARTRRLLAMTGFNATLPDAVQVGGVWTPHELRGRGYSRCVVAASLRDVRRQGATKAVLFTGVGNIAAQKSYEAIGFERIGEFRLLFLK